MGPVGMQEMIFIFLLALLLFGPKKLPELGRMMGKAITEFRRAQSELKSTFEREMRNLERETESLKEITGGQQSDHYNYDYSSYDSSTYGDPYGSSAGSPDSTVTDTVTASASATEGAGSLAAVPPEGVVAHETETAANSNGQASHEGAEPERAAEYSPAEHNA